MPKLLLSLALGLLAAVTAQAQNAPANPAAARAPANAPGNAPGTAPARPAPAPNCLVSEFRAMALGTHDLKERGSKATDWLRRNLAGCSEDQLRIIYANRSNWLGNADSMQLTSQIEGALEARLRNRPEQLAQLFSAPPPRPPASETLRAGDLAPRPAPVVGGTPAVVQQTAGTPATSPAVAPAVAGPVATPPGRPPAAGAPTAEAKKPEPGKFFDPGLRKSIQDYFTANRGNGPCPSGLILKNSRCESSQAQRSWKIGQALPASLSTRPLPARLLEALGPTPQGHSYVQVDGDILLLAEDGKTVVDAVLDLGQISPRS
jgi:hypothetical protein